MLKFPYFLCLAQSEGKKLHETATNIKISPKVTLRFLILYRPCTVINCIKSPTRCTFSYVFIVKFALYVSNGYTVYHQQLTYHCIYSCLYICLPDCEAEQLVTVRLAYVQTAVCTVTRKLMMINGVSVRNM